MSVTFRLDIATVGFIVNSPLPIYPQAPPPAYRQFWNTEAESDPADEILINLSVGDPPEMTDWEKIFDSGSSWLMYGGPRGYRLVFSPPNFDVPLWSADFDFQWREVSVRCDPQMVIPRAGERRLSNPVAYPLDQILMMYFLSTQRGVVLHGAGARRGDGGIVLAGPSGAGKSTITRLLSPADGVEMCSDDRMVVRWRGDSFWAFGTPWPGEEGAAHNTGFPLRGLYFLRHDGRNEREELSPAAALERLLPVVSNPWFDREVSGCILTACDELLREVPAYDLRFTQDHRVVDYLDEIGAI